MANEKLGVATEPSPESLWGALSLCSGGLSIGVFAYVQWGLTF